MKTTGEIAIVRMRLNEELARKIEERAGIVPRAALEIAARALDREAFDYRTGELLERHRFDVALETALASDAVRNAPKRTRFDDETELQRTQREREEIDGHFRGALDELMTPNLTPNLKPETGAKPPAVRVGPNEAIKSTSDLTIGELMERGLDELRSAR